MINKNRDEKIDKKINIVHKSLFYNVPTLILIILTYVGMGLLGVMSNMNFGKLLDIGISGNRSGFKEQIFVLIVIALSSVLLKYLSTIIDQRYFHKVLEKIRVEMFKGISSSNMSEYTKEESGVYTSRLVNDIKIIEGQYLGPIKNTVNSVIGLIIAIYYIFSVNVKISIFVLFAALLPVVIPIIFKKKLSTEFSNYSDSYAGYCAKINSILEGFDVIKTYDASSKIINIHNIESNDNIKVKKRAFNMMNFVTSLTVVATLFIYIGVLLFGMYMVINNKMTVGQMFALNFIAGNITGPLNLISNNLSNIKASSKIIEKFAVYENVKAEDKIKISNISRDVEFNNYSLKIGDKIILDKINLTLEKGKKYLFVGSSGCGKSTLVKSLLGYFENYEGEILIDGKNLKIIDKESLYNNISYVPQNVTFFTGTIKDNILDFKKDKENQSIVKYLEDSYINEKVDGLKNKEETNIDWKISEMSGGEKQRLGISRAFSRNKDIFIFDESTSALDAINYELVEKKITSLCDTIIAVSHKLNPNILRNYDEIIVMNKGKIVEKGKFDTLLNNNSFFSDLYHGNII